MFYHSQNLNEKGSIFWHGRAWLNRRSEKWPRREFRWEWLFGKFSRNFAITASFGYGEDDRGVCLHICIPWLFSIYFVVSGIYACKECQTGIGIHDSAIWFYPLPYSMENSSTDPWWRKNYCWHFPWDLDWYSTELLDGRGSVFPKDMKVVRREQKGDGKRGLKSFSENYENNKALEASVSQRHPYVYMLKSGEVQNRIATVFCSRMTWRARWWPIIPRVKVQTSIDVAFDAEVGEGTGSWKGGCVGSGYNMLPDETILQCLWRMERELKFNR